MLSQDQVQQVYGPFNQTPIKRAKDHQKVEPSTAESDQTPSPSSPSALDDIDSQELFNHFSQIITIIEDDQLFEDQTLQEVERSLDYLDISASIKLDFNPRSSSMKKKKKFNQRQNEFIGIRLFKTELNHELKLDSPSQTVEVQECLTPVIKKRTLRPDLFLAPMKCKS